LLDSGLNERGSLCVESELVDELLNVLPVLNLGLVLPLLSLQPLGHRVDELGIVAAEND